MTNTQIHPLLQKRREEVQTSREEKYNAVRNELTDDLRKSIAMLVAINNRTNLELISSHIDLARKLYTTIRNTPPGSPVSNMVHVGLQHLQNGMTFLENFSQRAAEFSGNKPREINAWDSKALEMRAELLEQEKVITEEIDCFLKTMDQFSGNTAAS